MEIERMKEPVSSYNGRSSENIDIKSDTASGAARTADSTRPEEVSKPDGELMYKTAVTEEPEQVVNGNNTQIKKAVEEINRKAHNSEAIFGIHDATNRVTIKIVDKDSKKVLKEYPPEKTLDMIAKVWEVAGLLVDEKR